MAGLTVVLMERAAAAMCCALRRPRNRAKATSPYDDNVAAFSLRGVIICITNVSLAIYANDNRVRAFISDSFKVALVYLQEPPTNK